MSGVDALRRVRLGEAWPQLPEALRQGFIDRMQPVEPGSEAAEDGLETLDDLLSWPCLFAAGDLALADGDWARACGDASPPPLLVVAGSLRMPGRPPECLVGGDLHCETFVGLVEDVRVVAGRVHAPRGAWLYGPDDEQLHVGPPMAIEAPHVFLWFHHWRGLALPPEAVVHLFCEAGLNTLEDDGPPAGPWLLQEDDRFALRPGLMHGVGSWDDHNPPWDRDAISAALARGESLFIDGVDPAAFAPLRRARRLRHAKRLPEAWAAAREALGLAPGLSHAWHLAAELLWDADALAQARPLLAEASARFPAHLRFLQDRALDDLALCALRLGEPAEAAALATRSIERIDHDDHAGLRGLPFRVRGEARLLLGDVEGALADLREAVRLRPFHRLSRWLLGLAFARAGDATRAFEEHERASRDQPRFAQPYAGATGSAWFYATPTRVDWPGA